MAENRRLWAAALSCIFLLNGCGTDSTTAGPGAQSADVYAAGYQNAGANNEAIYWKNGSPVVLSDRGYGSIAFSIAVANGHTYVAGVRGSASGRDIVTLWTDGIAQELTDGTSIAAGGNLFVSGNDVYVAGTETTGTGAPSVIAEYWKNGVKTVLKTGGFAMTANGIAVSGNDVYVAGSEIVTTQISPGNYSSAPAAVLWKNGVESYITTGPTLGEAYGIAIAGSDLYLAGTYCGTPANSCNTAVYWKNGAMNPVDGGQVAIANGIAVAGTNVYVPVVEFVGSSISADVWAAGKLTSLSTSQNSAANTVFVRGNDAYIGGAENNIATYWKNGTKVSLGTTPSTILSIAVVQP